MATAYTTVEGFELEPPVFQHFLDKRGDFDGYEEALNEYEERLINHIKMTSRCDNAGEVIAFPVADNFARYAIFDYNSIVHIPNGDDYRAFDATIKGLNERTIRDLIAMQTAFDKVFSN